MSDTKAKAFSKDKDTEEYVGGSFAIAKKAELEAKIESNLKYIEEATKKHPYMAIAMGFVSKVIPGDKDKKELGAFILSCGYKEIRKRKAMKASIAKRKQAGR